MTVTAWVDVFTRKNHRDAVIDSLQYCIEHKGLNVFAYCLMSNHLHVLVNVDDPFDLSAVIRDFKKYTSKRIMEQIQEEPESRREWMLNLFSYAGKQSKSHKTFKFWQAGNHAIEVYSPEFTWDKVNYIHSNPVEEGLVNCPEDWLYSSARNYSGEEEVILEKVVCIGRILNTVK